MAILRAAHWRNSLAKVGLGVPLFAVHDLGMLAIADPRSAPIGVRPFVGKTVGPLAQAAPQLALWAETLREVAASEVVERARQWRLGDDLLAVLLLRVLGPIWERHLGPGRRPPATPLPLDPEVYRDLEPELPTLFNPAGSSRRDPSLDFLDHLVRERLRIITAVEQIDLDTLRLLGMFGAEAAAAGATGLIDLLHVLENPDANDVVNFSLDLLPSVLETRRTTGAQTFSVDGYAGLARRGTLDSLMLSELAYDEDLFDQRFSENEVFYYARDKTREDERRCHYICVDATASMRGQRSVFARGLALTMIKKLLLKGEDVFFRFFDSRLYEVHQARAKRKQQTIDVPYVLSFKGEHGRNYAKVMSLLANDIERLGKREKKSVVCYLITHAECHVPIDVIEDMRRVSQLYGIFMLPSSGELDLEYLPRLHRVQIVTQAALEQREERAKRAMDIIDDAAGEAPARAPGARTSLPPGSAEERARAEDLAAATREVERLVNPAGRAT